MGIFLCILFLWFLPVLILKVTRMMQAYISTWGASPCNHLLIIRNNYNGNKKDIP